MPDAVAPEPPEWIDGAALEKWHDMVAQLEPLGLVTTIDRDALARYCDTWAWWRKCREFVMKHGDSYPIKNSDGSIKYLVIFPQVGQANKLAAQLGKLEQEFGLTPSSRSRVSVTTKNEKEQSGKSAFFQSGA